MESAAQSQGGQDSLRMLLLGCREQIQNTGEKRASSPIPVAQRKAHKKEAGEHHGLGFAPSQEGHRSNFAYLNDVLPQILSNLPSYGLLHCVGLVCKRWRRVALESITAYTVYQIDSIEEVLKFPALTHLTLLHLAEPTTGFAEPAKEITMPLPRLHRLTVENGALPAVLRCNTSLSFIKLCNPFPVLADTLAWLTHSSASIAHLVLDRLPNRAIREVLMGGHFPSLCSFCLSHVIDRTALAPIFEAFLLNHSRLLVSLACCDVGYSVTADVVPVLPKLKHLELPFVTFASFLKYFVAMPSILSVALSGVLVSDYKEIWTSQYNSLITMLNLGARSSNRVQLAWLFSHPLLNLRHIVLEGCPFDDPIAFECFRNHITCLSVAGKIPAGTAPLTHVRAVRFVPAAGKALQPIVEFPNVEVIHLFRIKFTELKAVLNSVADSLPHCPHLRAVSLDLLLMQVGDDYALHVDRAALLSMHNAGVEELNIFSGQDDGAMFADLRQWARLQAPWLSITHHQNEKASLPALVHEDFDY